MCEYFISFKLSSISLHRTYSMFASVFYADFFKRWASSFVAAARAGRIVPSQEVVKVMYDHVARYITWTRIESNLYARCTVRRETLRGDCRCPPAWCSTCVLLLRGRREGRANAHLQQLAHKNSKVITCHSWILFLLIFFMHTTWIWIEMWLL